MYYSATFLTEQQAIFKIFFSSKTNVNFLTFLFYVKQSLYIIISYKVHVLALKFIRMWWKINFIIHVHLIIFYLSFYGSIA